ncbi:MAG TPA: hypothetical protein VFS34_13590 [Thermoanaerobaculia bacterium]|nr:hypothetical protein [Thermoanaerobaculia bacterium]
MSRAATSIRVFGIYLVLLGAVVVAVPNLVLALVGLPPTSEVWIRVVGLLAAILGFYYLQAARHDFMPFYRASVPARVVAFLTFAAFVLFRFVKPSLILFGAVDLSGAAWTFFALSSSRRPR